MEIYIALLCCCCLGAVVQSSCGSGYSMVVTALLPLFMPFSDAVVISCIGSLFGNILLVTKYRRSIRFRVIWLPALACMVVTCVMIAQAGALSDQLLKRAYGVVLILLALFFFFLGKRIRMKASVGNSILIGGLVGLTNGLFAVGGPLISLYLLSFLEDKDEFMGTAQFFFLISGLTSLFSRILNGMVTAELAGKAAVGYLAVFCGMLIGTAIFKRMSIATLKRVVYLFVAVIGVYLLLGF